MVCIFCGLALQHAQDVHKLEVKHNKSTTYVNYRNLLYIEVENEQCTVYCLNEATGKDIEKLEVGCTLKTFAYLEEYGIVQNSRHQFINLLHLRARPRANELVLSHVPNKTFYISPIFARSMNQALKAWNLH